MRVAKQYLPPFSPFLRYLRPLRHLYYLHHLIQNLPRMKFRLPLLIIFSNPMNILRLPFWSLLCHPHFPCQCQSLRLSCLSLFLIRPRQGLFQPSPKLFLMLRSITFLPCLSYRSSLLETLPSSSWRLLLNRLQRHHLQLNQRFQHNRHQLNQRRNQQRLLMNCPQCKQFHQPCNQRIHHHQMCLHSSSSFFLNLAHHALRHSFLHILFLHSHLLPLTHQ